MDVITFYVGTCKHINDHLCALVNCLHSSSMCSLVSDFFMHTYCISLNKSLLWINGFDYKPVCLSIVDTCIHTYIHTQVSWMSRIAMTFLIFFWYPKTYQDLNIPVCFDYLIPFSAHLRWIMWNYCINLLNICDPTILCVVCFVFIQHKQLIMYRWEIKMVSISRLVQMHINYHILYSLKYWWEIN